MSDDLLKLKIDSSTTITIRYPAVILQMIPGRKRRFFLIHFYVKPLCHSAHYFCLHVSVQPFLGQVIIGQKLIRSQNFFLKNTTVHPVMGI